MRYGDCHLFARNALQRTSVVGFFLFSTLPCMATSYTLDVGEGSNKAHAGTWTIDVTYDPKTQMVTFKVLNGTGKLGQDTWDGWTWTVPATLAGDVVTFDGASATPIKPNGRTGGVSNKLVFTDATLNIKTQALSIKSIANTDMSAKYPLSNFAIVKPPETPKDGKKADSAVPPNKSLDFDAATQTLSIAGSTIVGLPNPGDPLLGAAVSYPDFVLAGFNSQANAYVFINQDLSNELSMSKSSTVFETSEISALYYNVAENLLYGVVFGNTFDEAGSSFIDYVSGVLDPTSSSYDPLARYYVDIIPGGNLYSLTQGFTADADIGALDQHFLADPVPEPSSFALFGVGLLGLLGYGWRVSIERKVAEPLLVQARS